jgi:hypothetical protein
MQNQTHSKPARADMHTSIASSFNNTLRGSNVVEAEDSPNKMNLVFEPARRETAEDVEYQSREIEDEVNQLDFDAASLINPISQAASNGNLNVQTLIEYAKNPKQKLTRPIRP